MSIDYNIIGKRIASRRKDLRLTQADLAEKVDLSVKHISSVENANSIPSLETIMHICCALDINVHYVLFGVDDKIPSSLITEILRHLTVSTPQELEDFLYYIENSKSIS